MGRRIWRKLGLDTALAKGAARVCCSIRLTTASGASAAAVAPLLRGCCARVCCSIRLATAS